MTDNSISGSLTPCRHCGKDVNIDPRDYYVLNTNTWLLVNDGSKDGNLCMSCVEARLGRKLMKEDILVCRVTSDWNPYTRAILQGSADSPA